MGERGRALAAPIAWALHLAATQLLASRLPLVAVSVLAATVAACGAAVSRRPLRDGGARTAPWGLGLGVFFALLICAQALPVCLAGR